MKSHFILTATIIACMACSCNDAPLAWSDFDKEQVQIGKDIAIVSTEYGKVQGYIMRDIYTFMGIPYGHDTSGDYRFMPPAAPEAWAGIKPCVFYGASCPQCFYDRSAESFGAFVDHWNYDVLSEDCLRLNVWTPAVGDTKKRPVIVWLHGGGFAKGNSMEQDGYSGENISRYGDIVFCSVNHRLNSLGFSDFASVGGEKYRHSGNVGMLDIVAALRWVRNNIEAFGGDPDNVTIMGQSGGGGKVCILCNMPSAKGLFAKAVALSGNHVRGQDKEKSEALGAAILHEAGLDAKDIDKLQQMPWDEYQAIAAKASAKAGTDFRPVADGEDIIQGLFFPADEKVSDVPTLFCSTFFEWNPDRDKPEMEDISMDEVVEALKGRYGENARKIVDAYHRNFPSYRPIEIYALILSHRYPLIECANAKMRQSSPVYVAWFGRSSRLFDGRHRSFHCSDISYWLLNTDRMITHTGGGKKARKLSYKMADALLSFIRTGTPAAKGLPKWMPYTLENKETMILNDVCYMQNYPDGIGLTELSKAL